jgi:hypothetical protein
MALNLPFLLTNKRETLHTWNGAHMNESLMIDYPKTFMSYLHRVEVPINGHLRDYAPNLEKYKVVQVILV